MADKPYDPTRPSGFDNPKPAGWEGEVETISAREIEIEPDPVPAREIEIVTPEDVGSLPDDLFDDGDVDETE